VGGPPGQRPALGTPLAARTGGGNRPQLVGGPRARPGVGAALHRIRCSRE
jgi:hypothetical protein